MNKKLNNLLNFSDFENNWKAGSAKSTVNTDTGLDVVGEEGGSTKQEMDDWYKGGQHTTKRTDVGVDVVKESKELHNLLNFSDFENNWKAGSAKSTVNTDTGWDVVGEEGGNNKQEMDDWYKGGQKSTKKTDVGVDVVKEHKKHFRK